MSLALDSTPSMLEEARALLVGGVNSPVRAFRRVGGNPLILVQGQGAEVRDDQGRTYLDLISGWGCLLLGHNPSMVVDVLRDALTRGAPMGLTHPAEIELARRIADAMPSIEQVRFTVSGTEACMTAVKLARAHTGRSKILVFEGCYHGHGESLMSGNTAGLPEGLARDTLSIPFNDSEAVESTLRRSGRELACVIIEPVAANMGVIAPEPGFLARLRELTSQHGILLIFDEVVTGFRVGPGGAQTHVRVSPDLTTLGKIIGGGLPIGAVGGPRRLMRRLAPEGDVYHAGTFAGFALSMLGGVAALTELKTHPPYVRLEQLADGFASGLSEAASAAGVPIQINRVGSMFTVFFSESPVRNMAQASASHEDRFAHWARALREQGILIPPSPYEALFLSTAHTDGHRDRFVRASAAAFRSMEPS